jgi:HEAT repeat protein
MATALLGSFAVAPRSSGQEAEVRGAAPDTEHVESLIEDLGADRFADRDQATRALIELGPRVHDSLRGRLHGERDPEVRARLTFVLRADQRRVVAMLRHIKERGNGRTLVLRRAARQVQPARWKPLVGLGERAIEPLVGVIREELGPPRRVDLLKLAIQGLGQIGTAAIADPVASLTDAPIDSFVGDLGRLLAEHAGEAAVAPLEQRLGAEDGAQRLRALRLLGRLGNLPGVRQALRRGLSDPEARVRLATVTELVRVDGKQELVALREALDDPDQGVQMGALTALALLEDPGDRVREAVRVALAEPLPLGRPSAQLRAAIQAAGLLRDASATDALLEIVDKIPADEQPSLFSLTLVALGRIRAPQALEALGRGLATRGGAVSRDAIYGLGQLATDEAVAALAGYIREVGRSEYDRRLAYAALHEVGTSVSRAALVELFKERGDREALDGLLLDFDEEALGQAALAGVRAGLEDEDFARGALRSDLRAHCAQLLGQINPEGGLDALGTRVENGDIIDETFSYRLVEALGEIGGDRAEEFLVSIVESGEHVARDQALRALARMGRPDRLLLLLPEAEARVKAQPLDSRARNQLGIDLIYLARYEEAIVHFRANAENETWNSTAFYNIACCLSLLGRKEEALREIQRTVEVGYSDWRHMRLDADFISLRKEEEFWRVLFKIRPAIAPQTQFMGGFDVALTREVLNRRAFDRFMAERVHALSDDPEGLDESSEEPQSGEEPEGEDR